MNPRVRGLVRRLLSFSAIVDNSPQIPEVIKQQLQKIILERQRALERNDVDLDEEADEIFQLYNRLAWEVLLFPEAREEAAKVFHCLREGQKGYATEHLVNVIWILNPSVAGIARTNQYITRGNVREKLPEFLKRPDINVLNLSDSEIDDLVSTTLTLHHSVLENNWFD